MRFTGLYQTHSARRSLVAEIGRGMPMKQQAPHSEVRIASELVAMG